jgi:hypothetical protein
MWLISLNGAIGDLDIIKNVDKAVISLSRTLLNNTQTLYSVT